MPRDQFYERLALFLGHVIIEHGNLEGDAGRMLARLNGKGDDVSAAIHAAKNTFNEKIAKARRLVELKITDVSLKAEFEIVLLEMERLNRARNSYIHSEYLPEVDQNEAVVRYHYREIKQMGDVLDINDPNSEIAVHQVDIPTLEKLIEDMIALGLQIRVVSEKYFDALPYSPPPK